MAPDGLTFIGLAIVVVFIRNVLPLLVIWLLFALSGTRGY